MGISKIAQAGSIAPEQIFRDDGYSGASLRRPGLDRLRDAVAGARLDRILITAPDRLARNYVHQMLLVEELQGHGAVVEFLDRPMSQDPHDQLLLQIRGAVAEYERTLITERMRRGRLRKLRAGVLLPWTRPPYGYRGEHAELWGADAGGIGCGLSGRGRACGEAGMAGEAGSGAASGRDRRDGAGLHRA